MNAPLRRTKRGWLGLLFPLVVAPLIVAPLVVTSGCNELIGANDPTAREVDSSAACVLNSDCEAGQLCIFRVCSPPCHADGDCAAGFRCLQTQAGTACVGNTVAVCDSAQSCPSGSDCRAGSCRNVCQSSNSCLAPQQCVDGTCVGLDPNHDPGLDAAVGVSEPDASLPDAPSEGTSDAAVDQSADRTVAEDAADGVSEDAAAQPKQDSAEEGMGMGNEASPDAADAGAEAEAGCGDTNTDVHNCGACKHDCSLLSNVSAAGLMCSAGRCVYQCASGHADCSDAGAGCETDLTTSPNCGACGVTCGGGTPLCAPSSSPGGSACASGCPTAAPTLCSNACVDTTTSAANCGKCGMACTTTVVHAVPECVASGCTTTCATGYSSCAGACVDETSDDNNCSMCGNKCTGGTHCVSGSCQCTGGTHLCSGSCVANDTSACGASCMVCTAPTGGTATCDGTSCAQACTTGGQTVCSNTCVDKSTDTSNCGVCGMACTGSTPYCVNGGCVQCTTGTQCASTGNTPQVCTANQWVNQTPCSGATPVCYSGGCVACTSGTQCDSTNTVVQTCSANQWVTQTTCTTSQICRSAMCVSAVHDVGWDTALSGSFPLSANALYTFKLPPLAHDAKLLAFGAYGNAAADAGVTAARMAVYPDNGSGTAPSGMPIGYIASPAFLGLSNGPVEQTASLNGTGTLSANTVYWIGIIVSASTTIYSTSDTAGLGNGYPVSYPSFPTTLSGNAGSAFNGIDVAIYINVQDLN